METRGRLKDIGISFPTRKAVITVEVTASPEDCERYRDQDLSVTIKKYRKRRSLSANAYYWVLCSQTARVMKISSTRLHNLMLRDYGCPYTIDGKIVTITIPDTEEAESNVLESDTFHVKPTTKITTNSKGTTYRQYILLQGSHQMDTKEFSSLLDHMIAEAKGQGIETLPPDEIARMKAELENR